MGSLAAPWLVTALLLALTGCVTETIGGSDLTPDPKAAFERRIGLARQYIARGDWENAERNLDLAVALDADNAEVYEAFGLLYQSTGELQQAESSFRQALKADPKFSRARNNFAVFLMSQNRYAEAEKELERVVDDTLYSGRPRAFINLGTVRLRLNDAEGAEAAFDRALRMDRRNPIALLEMGFLALGRGDIAAADSYYNVYRTVMNRQPPRGLVLGIELSAAKGDKDAQSSYGLALRNLYPDSPEAKRYAQQQKPGA